MQKADTGTRGIERQTMTRSVDQTSAMRNRPAARQRGAAAVLAMMFLVIFSSLAAAMAIVSQGNLSTAETHLRVNRALASAETGMSWLIYRINQVTSSVQTRDGLIDATNAPALWTQTRDGLLASIAGEGHNLEEPVVNGNSLEIGPISLGPGAPPFVATLTPHPLPGENYDSAYYQRPPYSTMNPPVSNAAPLDATWIRVKVTSTDGVGESALSRAIQMDFRLEKRIRFALLSKSRVMIGRNVVIDGPIGSRFNETHLQNGHPVQMVSDFRGLHEDLDDNLDNLTAWLKTNDTDGDNRLHVANANETAGISDPESIDVNADGFIDEFDFFLYQFDANGDRRVSATELGATADIASAQLMELIDTFGDASRAGFNDGFIDSDDRYAKIRGEVKLLASKDDWESGAADTGYQDHFQGPIDPTHGEPPLTFEATETALHDFGPEDFDTSTFRAIAAGDLQAQAAAQLGGDPTDPNTPRYDNGGIREEVPYGAAYPYDYYQRPVYENMVFENVTIPKGTNALFKNCVFRGVTFVDTEIDNDDPDFNYAGMEESDGTPKHPDRVAMVNGVEVENTKAVSNNLRFDGCTFEGAIVSAAPQEYTHVRNKIAFTGRTRFKIDDSAWLSPSEKTLYKRSTILSPHYSVEMGTFVSPSDSNETVHLSGTIVAGLIDMRGQVKINGTILTTFEPKSNQGPVLGDTSPQFNTTLGYFPKDAGDLEAELPPNGVGVIQVRYDPTLPLPDGILGSISVTPQVSTYFELGAN